MPPKGSKKSQPTPLKVKDDSEESSDNDIPVETPQRIPSTSSPLNPPINTSSLSKSFNFWNKGQASQPCSLSLSALTPGEK